MIALIRPVSAKKISTVLLSLLIFIFLPAAAAGHDVLFLGITDKKGEPTHGQLETEIRRYLASNRRLRLQSEVETQRVIREIERVGRKLTESFIPPNAGISDTAVIIRGVAEDLSFTPKRRLLLWGRIEGRLTVTMYFAMINGPAAYHGEFTASVRKNKGFLLFADPQKTIHVSAPDRSEMTGKLQSEIVKKVSDFSGTFFNSLETGPLHRRAAEAEAAAAGGNDGGATPDGAGNAGGDDFPGAGELMTE